MKRNLYLILALLFVGSVQMSAQKMVVALNNSTEVFLDEDITTSKITFSDGKMLFHVNGAVKNTFEIKDINRIYTPRYSSVEALDVLHEIAYLSATQELIVGADPGTVIAIYYANGAKALSHIQTIASTPISVAHLPAGAYVVVLGGKTLKFVKQ
ncbi:MAG: hypothetical protein J6S11_02900 [Bacteroidaceae bacterium]|nr:hypothetical protein [Bacteroidaceae bacterium]MBO7266855.1 hypothetical protein [Bacteroidaceae bacterium]